MARISGVTIPNEKQIWVSLTYIFGIGETTSRKILNDIKIDPTLRVKDLSEADLAAIRDEIAKYNTEGDLHRVVSSNIKRLRDINSYRGIRHKNGLPSRGQRTRTNARTRRGRKVTVGGTQKKVASKT
jgi:small subunit ribosomal protein S13